MIDTDQQSENTSSNPILKLSPPKSKEGKSISNSFSTKGKNSGGKKKKKRAGLVFETEAASSSVDNNTDNNTLEAFDSSSFNKEGDTVVSEKFSGNRLRRQTGDSESLLVDILKGRKLPSALTPGQEESGEEEEEEEEVHQQQQQQVEELESDSPPPYPLRSANYLDKGNSMPDRVHPGEAENTVVSKCTEDSIMSKDNTESDVNNSEPTSDQDEGSVEEMDSGDEEEEGEHAGERKDTTTPLASQSDRKFFAEDGSVGANAGNGHPRPKTDEEMDAEDQAKLDAIANKPRRGSLLKQNSAFMTVTGEHITDKPKKGRRLSFSDESGEKLVETAFSDKLHYSSGHTFNNAPVGGEEKKGCCVIC